MKKLNLNFLRRRRDFVSQLCENSIAVIPNKLLSIRTNDVEYKFRPDSDFYYLTGFEEPNSICVLKKEKRGFSYFLFVEGREQEKEIWIGRKVGIEGAKSIYKADEAYLITEFDGILKRIISGVENLYFPFGVNKDLDKKITDLVGDFRAENRSGIKAPKAIHDPRDILHGMRLIKDSYEINCIQRACDISKDAHILAISYAKSGFFEYELEALLEYKFRREGGIGPAYPSIVGSGKNATTLHYINNNRKIQKDDLILIDAGCEFEYYASDVTRTFPVNKKFSGLKKELYEIVLEAQIKAIEQIKPGKRFIDSYNKAVSVLVDGLKEIGLLKGSTHEIIHKGKYKKFFMHKLSHWLGLDVHDAGPYIDGKGSSIKLAPGMVMTVEPGIYISKNLENIPERFHGIGIRIEDDVLITKNGNKILTSGIPKTIKEIESFGSGY